MKNSLKTLVRSPKFMFGLITLVIILLVIFIVPLVNTSDPYEMVGTIYDAPGTEGMKQVGEGADATFEKFNLVLGTDNFGRDLFLELMYGTKTSLWVGVLAGLIATAIGLTLGLWSGYVGGIIDDIIQTITNMFTVIPSIVILILISVSVTTRSYYVTALVIGLTSWPWTCRSVRAQTASLRVRDHVNIARITGYSTMRIIVQHVLPYVASYVMMAFIRQISSGILNEATISMLGLGPYNTISLGTMMNWAQQFEAPTSGAWWAFVPTAMVIALVIFALTMMNTGMDEIFNPKIRS